MTRFPRCKNKSRIKIRGKGFAVVEDEADIYIRKDTKFPSRGDDIV